MTEREFYIFNHQNISIAIHEHANYQDYLNRRSRRQDLIDLLLRFLDPTDTYNIAIPEADKDDRHNFLRYYVWESLLAYWITIPDRIKDKFLDDYLYQEGIEVTYDDELKIALQELIEFLELQDSPNTLIKEVTSKVADTLPETPPPSR